MSLSNPSTQTLALNYRSGSETGSVVFAAGETTQSIPVLLSADQVNGTTPGELRLGLTGNWVSGEFSVGLNTFSSVELFGLRRDFTVTVQFTLSYLFVDPENNEEAEELLLLPLDTLIGADGEPLVISVKVTEGADADSDGTGNDLVDATSLKAWSTPRQMTGI